MITELWIGKDLEGSGWIKFKVLARHLFGGAEENQEKHASIAGFQAKVWIRVLPNTKLEC
jgi:hypothetical protein